MEIFLSNVKASPLGVISFFGVILIGVLAYFFENRYDVIVVVMWRCLNQLCVVCEK